MDALMSNGCIVYLTFPTVQRLCPSCSHYVTTCPAKVRPSGQATWRLMEMVNCWASVAPNNQVAAMFDISHSTIGKYDKEVLQRDTPLLDLDNLRTLSVDEKPVGRGHNYLTIVLNGDTGELHSMKPGKKKEVLDGFLQQISESQRQSIEAVGIDRAGAYQTSIEEHMPDVEIVYNRFHLRLKVNKAVDEVRRVKWREAKGEEKNEEGSVAAGTTHVMLTQKGSAMSNPITMANPITVDINRPFFCIIQNKETGNCVFMANISRQSCVYLLAFTRVLNLPFDRLTLRYIYHSRITTF